MPNEKLHFFKHDGEIKVTFNVMIMMSALY